MPADKQPTRGAVSRRHLLPLYAAGFTTAFGAHAVAANLGAYSAGHGQSLLLLGVMLALYDGAEVLLKPVFGALSDRIGPRPVLLGGLVAFALFSAGFVLARDPAWLWLARLGQGAAASAFSPAASTLVSRLNPVGRQGRAFGSYGFSKSIGYTAGPLIGGTLVAAGGLGLVFILTALLALLVAVWAFLGVPVVSPLPRSRQSVADLARRLSDRAFLAPTATLAAATAALSVGVGFLPLSGAAAGLGSVATGAAVSVLALCAAVVQPLAGRASDTSASHQGRLAGLGLVLTTVGLAAAMLPGIAGLLAAAVGIGAGTGIITPVAFAALARATPPERLGQTMGAAEVGRELGDAGGPLLVGAVAATVSLTAGYGVLALLTAAVGIFTRPSRAGTGRRSQAAVETSPTRTELG
ncbi:MFS transporter [Paenarthrobacter sp. Z7-10]|uniref:MFS transporter n=1 Tax=Paenarthrobacter sp. Z7-10 TaxID=2787635 RepID=UPI0022A9CE50|nr:MFS transporter [Paenarthrobacter sp. Z7-10]MCZ2404706.1 MFS transporter [Paenarthrobacter sp. Z7-10]